MDLPISAPDDLGCLLLNQENSSALYQEQFIEEKSSNVYSQKFISHLIHLIENDQGETIKESLWRTNGFRQSHFYYLPTRNLLVFDFY